MGIGTVDALLNGRIAPQDWYKDAFTGEAAGGYHSPLYVSGLPGAGSAPDAGVNGEALTSRSGAITFPSAAAGKSVYLNSASLTAASGVGAAFLVDRLWENSGLSVTSTSSQAITPATLPERDANGSTNGVGVGLAIEIVTATANVSAVTATITYTDSDANTGNTGTISIPASAVAGTWLPLDLAAGDYGVRAVTAFQLASSLTSGALSIVLYRRISRNLNLVTSNIGDSFGPADGGGPVHDNTVPHFVYILSSTTVGVTSGSVQFVQA